MYLYAKINNFNIFLRVKLKGIIANGWGEKNMYELNQNSDILLLDIIENLEARLRSFMEIAGVIGE